MVTFCRLVVYATQNLKFAEADARLNDSRLCRASALEHLSAAGAAKKAAETAAKQHKTFLQRRKQLLREVHLLHTAANHLQGALSALRDKHHLLRKLRDVEYQHGQRPQPMESSCSLYPGPVPEREVLRTQVGFLRAPLSCAFSSQQCPHVSHKFACTCFITQRCGGPRVILDSYVFLFTCYTSMPSWCAGRSQ